jgi:phage replication O-like protein O
MKTTACDYNFTPFPNELVEQFARFQLSGYLWRIVFAIIRDTWGYEEFKDGPRRQKHRISITTFQKKTGLHRRHAHQALKELIKRNIVTEISNGKSVKYGIQKDYSKWLSLPKSAQTKNRDKCAEIRNVSLPESVTQSLPESVTPSIKDRKKIFKESGGGLSDPLEGQSPPPSKDNGNGRTIERSPDEDIAAKQAFAGIYALIDEAAKARKGRHHEHREHQSAAS